MEVKELARMQGFSSGRALLYSHRTLLDLLHVDSDDPNLITMKRLAAYPSKDGGWTNESWSSI